MKHLNSTKKGIVISILILAIQLFSFYILDTPVKSKWQFAIYGVYIFGIVWTIASSRFQMHHVHIKSLFTEGFKAFIVVTLITTFFTFVFYKINPQLCENGIIENNQLLLKQGNKTPAEINENAEQFRAIFIPMMLAINIFSYLFLGALISLVSAGFLSKKI